MHRHLPEASHDERPEQAARLITQQTLGQRNEQDRVAVKHLGNPDGGCALAEDVSHRRPQQEGAQLVEQWTDQLETLSLRHPVVLIPERLESNWVIELRRQLLSHGRIQEQEGANGRDVVAASTVQVDPTKVWRRKFNLIEPVSLFLQADQATDLAIEGTGADAEYRVEPFLIGRPADYRIPPTKPSGVSTPTATISLDSVTSSGGTKNVNLVGLNGTIGLGSGALSGASGNAFDVSGAGTAVITYSGTIAGAMEVMASRTGRSQSLLMIAWSGPVTPTK